MKILPLPLILFLAASPTLAGGGMSGGATEFTQLINKAQLVDISAKSAAQVAGQVKDYALQVQQYTTMLRHLQQLPSTVLGAALGPYSDVVGDLASIYKDLTSAATIYQRTQAMLDGRIDEMGRLQMTPEEYLAAELNLARARGGAYRDKIEADRRLLEAAETKGRALQETLARTDAIGGNVEGFQHLAALNGMTVATLQDMNSQMRQAAVAAGYERAQAEDAKVLAARLEELRRKEQAAQDKALSDWASQVRISPYGSHLK